VAATSLKLFWERLQTASGTKSSEEALAKLGLAADQIDAIGEKPAEVLERLATAMDKLPKEEQAGVLKDLFGQEAMAAASGLLRDRAKVQQYLALQGDEAGFQADVGIRAAGPAAARTRVQLLQEQQMIAKNADFEEMVLAAESLQREAGIPEALLSFRRQRANLRNLMGDTSIESIAEIYTDPAQMQLPFYQRSGATLPPELLRQRILELRGEAPVDALGQTATVGAAAAQVAGSPEGGAAGAAAVEIQRQQLEQLRELNRNVRPAPDRKPEGGE
jgi:hypothetical protein